MKKNFPAIIFIVILYCVQLAFFSQKEAKGLDLTHNINVLDDNIKDDSSQNADPVEITNLYVLGKVPISWGLPDTLRIRVKKNISGYLPVNVNVKVINFFASIIVEDVTYQLNNHNIFDTIICHRLFTPPEIQTDLIIVEALPGDSAAPFGGDPSNDLLKYCHYVTETEFNHADPCKNDNGGTGFDGHSGNLVAGFCNKSSTNFFVGEIDHCFYNPIGGGNKPYKIVIYEADGSGKPGALLYISSTLTSPQGNGNPQRVSHEIDPPVSIPSNSKFFVGYRQSSTSSIRASYQTENPVRANSFFFSFPETSNTWYDFKDSSKNFNLDICAVGGGGLLNLTVIPEGLYNYSSNTLNIEDTVSAFLMQTGSPFTILDSAKGIINATTFSKILTFGNIPTGSYYLVVRHRNSVQTWSSSPISYTNGGTTEFNFTTSISQAYGDNMTQVDNFRYGIFSGDVNQDGYVDASDLLLIDNDVFIFASGYLSTDLNGDSYIDAADAAYIDNNATNFIGVIAP